MADEEEYDEEVEEVEEGEEVPGEEEEAAKEAEPQEDLPPEKEWDGELRMCLGGTTEAAVRFDHCPHWVTYMVADDMFYLRRTLNGGKTVVDAPAAPVEGEEGEEAPVEDGGEAEPEGTIAFEPNTMLVLDVVTYDPLTYTASLYTPPPPPAAAAEGEEGAAAEAGEEDAGIVEDEGEEALDEELGGSAEIAAKGQAQDTQQILIDLFTVATHVSVEMAVFCIRNGATTTQFEEWLLYTASAENNKAVECFTAALESFATMAPPQRHKMSMDYTWAVRKMCEAPVNPAKTAYLNSVIASFLQLGVAPTRFIPSDFLATHECVLATARILMGMPKSVLQGWQNPTPPADEEGEELPPQLPKFVVDVTCELRRRRKRSASPDRKGIRQPPQATLKPLMVPAENIENITVPEEPVMTDKVLCSNFGMHPARSYAPSLLRLYYSDLILLLLGTDSATESVFMELLNHKLNVIPRVKGDTIGTLQMLFFLINQLDEQIALRLVEVAPADCFAVGGPVDAAGWAAVLGEHGDGSHVRHSRLIASRFHDQLLAIPGLKQHLPELHNLCAETSDVIAEVRDTAGITASYFDTLVERVGESTIATPLSMHSAVTHENAELLLHLMRKYHVCTMQREPHHIPTSVLEYCCLNKKYDLLTAVVQSGRVNFNETLSMANTWTLPLPYLAQTASTEDGGAEAARVRELTELWKKLDADRAVDPRCRFGLLLGEP